MPATLPPCDQLYYIALQCMLNMIVAFVDVWEYDQVSASMASHSGQNIYKEQKQSSEPIKTSDRLNAKPKQIQITFDPEEKIAIVCEKSNVKQTISAVVTTKLQV